MDNESILAPFAHVIALTKRDKIVITASNEPTAIKASKFGGKPYLPAGVPYPVDAKGTPMMLLSQLNFEEIPHLPDYPERGILQFYISTTNEYYGCNFDDLLDQPNFCVLFHEETNEEGQQIEEIHIDEDYAPFSGERKLSFSLSSEPVSPTDFRFEETLGHLIGYDVDEDAHDVYWETYRDDGHKIGGYGYFTQFDPRGHERYRNHTLLLFQMDTDYENDIMWGDAGVANFFITPEDLRKRDFSRVLYNWDCC